MSLTFPRRQTQTAKFEPTLGPVSNTELVPTWSVSAHRGGAGSVERPRGGAGSAERHHILVSDDRRPPQVTTGDRFHHVFEDRCEQLGLRVDSHLAVDYGEVSYSYGELQAFSNQMAHYLKANGVRRGHRIAVLFDRSIYSHATVLALSKLDAVCVPLDAAFPEERIRFILDDAAVMRAITMATSVLRFAGPEGADTIVVDQSLSEIRRYPMSPIEPSAPTTEDPICYIIYTSGTTGVPKGVPIRHSSIVNFLRVAADIYGYKPTDRVYNGMTIAFDFSMEELWVPLAAGSTLVPAPNDAQLVGSDLAEFLIERNVNALCCVPTLLATIDEDLPDLRFLIVSGEACPSDLAERWLSPDRRMLNLYGPTETTVSATWTVMQPGAPVTIGGPLPTYSIAILDADRERVLSAGEVGEIAVGGIGLADGYLNRPEKTADVFVPDPIGLPDNPTGKLYRTGDLGRINDNNEIEFLGRIDTQVKIRGYRIELDEIAAVARSASTVGNAVVDVHHGSGSPDLVAYLTPTASGGQVDIGAVHSLLRDRLPAYMLPTYYECLEALPLLPSTKVNRDALPPPSGARYVGAGQEYVPPRTELEASLAEVLASSLELDNVSVEADFFDDLGADSLILAEFATAIRSELKIKRVSIRKLYENPSVAQLARLINPNAAPLDASAAGSASKSGSEPESEAEVETATVAATGETPNTDLAAKAERLAESDATSMADHATPLAIGPLETSSVVPKPQRLEPRIASRFAYVTSGLVMVAFFLVTLVINTTVGVFIARWSVAGGAIQVAPRAILSGMGFFLWLSVYATSIKWLAIGRFDTKPVPLWSVAYFRFFMARSAVQRHPMNLFVGTPAFNLHLRLLGAKIGRDAVIMTQPPICTDLFSIGSRTILREGTLVRGYTSRDGYIIPGPITIGDDCYVSEGTVFDINSEIGDDVQLGLVSSVAEGQRIPADTLAQGSPAQPTTTVFDTVQPSERDRGRAWRFVGWQFLAAIGLTSPISVLITANLLRIADWFEGLIPFSFLPAEMVMATVLYFGGILIALIAVRVIPRIVNLFLETDKTYPLFSVHDYLARVLARRSNSRRLNQIFGDSAMILGYLSWVGYDLRKATQTGSNFGVDQRHHSPFLCSFDRNTLVSDGLRMINQDMGSSSFRLRQVAVPADTYIGNAVFYPNDSKVGPDCLIATKAAVPVDGPTRTHVGILGSPAFEIPRSVARDHRFDHFKQPGIFEERLALKLKHNLGTVGIYIFRAWAVGLFAIWFGLSMLRRFDPNYELDITTGLVLSATAVATLIYSLFLTISIDWMIRGFRRLSPLYCSLYDERFWQHERYWKISSTGPIRLFDGTPMKAMAYRLLGAKIGKNLFDDGGGFPEPSLIEIGDNVTLNAGSTIQSHSLEDGTFKSDRTTVGDGTTFGVRAFIHYGVTIGDDCEIAADSFVMKGSVVPTGSNWFGNPARSTESELSASELDLSVGGDVGGSDREVATTGQQKVANRTSE